MSDSPIRVAGPPEPTCGVALYSDKPCVRTNGHAGSHQAESGFSWGQGWDSFTPSVGGVAEQEPDLARTEDEMTETVHAILAELTLRPDRGKAVTVGAFSRRIVRELGSAFEAVENAKFRADHVNYAAAQAELAAVRADLLTAKADLAEAVQHVDLQYKIIESLRVQLVTATSDALREAADEAADVNNKSAWMFRYWNGQELRCDAAEWLRRRAAAMEGKTK